MEKLRKWNGFKGLISILLMASLATACFMGPEIRGANQVTLSVMYYYTSEAGKEALKKILDDYQKQHPEIKLNVQVSTLQMLPDALRMRVLAKDPPDVAMLTPQMVGGWIEAGQLQEGNKFIPRIVLSKFDPVRALSVKSGSKYYGLPFSSSSRAVAYNADYFKKAGITPPQKASQAWTWEQLVSAAQKAQAASGAKYALQFEKPSFDGWLSFLYQAGGQLFSDDLQKSAINGPAARRALEWTIKLHKDGIAAPGMFEGTEDPARTFASGLSTMWLSTSNGQIEALESQMKFNYGFTFMPKDKQQATVVGGIDWVAFKGKYPKQAWDLLLYLVSPGPMGTFNAINTYIPPRSDVSAAWKNKAELAPFFAEQAKAMPKKLQIEQLTPAYAATREKLLQELSACISGQRSVDQTLSAWEKIINDYLKK
jgi:ABC-type glycerol-3-phosphate transport system substrate-binding protein